MTANAESAPTVVFVSQAGGDGGSWQPVIDRLVTDPATFTYDRPGIGGCPPRPAPNPALPYSAFADELATLLSGRRDGAVLVGHSVGSLIARMYAAANPSLVAGMVHVDGSIPRLSLWPVHPGEPLGDGDGPEATVFDWLAGEIEVVEAEGPRVATTVVTRTPGRWPAGISLGVDPLWTAYQRQLARHCGAPLIVADDAGHQIPAEAPALVGYAIDAVVAAVRSGSPVTTDAAALAAAGGSLDGAVRR
jgi:pimeloyl-ACP methyl ester carboxylesterase